MAENEFILNNKDVTMIIQTDSYSAYNWTVKNGNNIQHEKGIKTVV